MDDVSGGDSSLSPTFAGAHDEPPLDVDLDRRTVEQLIAVSDAGTVMPPKSTWFEPKLRSGVFVHTLD